MDTVTYPDPRVAEFIERHFVPVRVMVKQNQALAESYLVSWTPNVVIADEKGRVHYRVEGYLPAGTFVGCLSLGAGKCWLNRQQFIQAAERFEEVSERHADTDTGAEALYWLGVARYKQTHDPLQLRQPWGRLAQEYPKSEWAERTQIPAKG
jgi:hypothetical protein